jgi:hypothetical protein
MGLGFHKFQTILEHLNYYRMSSKLLCNESGILKLFLLKSKILNVFLLLFFRLPEEFIMKEIL